MEKKPLTEGTTRGIIKGGLSNTTAGENKNPPSTGSRPAPPPPIKK